jgi:serine/threonine-protein kinase
VVIGETLGSYRIVDLIGHGGMAAVYVGEHAMVRHRVAIKVVHPRHLDSPRMAQRFLNEARAVAAIRHPGIVEFYDLGRADDGRAYIVMELLAGETVAARMQKGQIPVPQAIAFARQMASALHAAHERGIVHRDLKPANVFLVPDPDVKFGERAKILDFGIAKHTEDREELTGAGVLVGTPAHMSPEQCRGERIDGRSDVYALGILLYHMVTGREPFDEGTTGEIVTKQICEDVPHASLVEPSVPVALSDVIARCMEKNRALRYPTMAAVADALSDVEEELALGAGPAAAPVPPPAWTNAPTVPVPVPVRAVEASASTLTRTIVHRPTWLGRVRSRIWKFALVAAGEIAVIAVAVSLATMGAASDGAPTVPARAPAATPSVGEPEILPELEPVVMEPESRARRPARDRRDKADRPDKPDRVEKVEKQERPEKPDKPSRPDKVDKPDRPEKQARPDKPAAKAKPAAKKPRAPEDPFESVATPAVY